MKIINSLYLPDNILYRDDYVGPVYRFFTEESHAEDFIRGKVYLSTLEKCRNYEDSERGDKQEGHQTYLSGHIVGDSNDPDLVEIARRTGILVGEGNKNISINNCTHTEIINDAYVLCTTINFLPENFEDTFGKYCVKIHNPKKFFITISKNLNSTQNIKNGVMGKVIYRDRHYTGLEPPPGPIGFVKPSKPYKIRRNLDFCGRWMNVLN